MKFTLIDLLRATVPWLLIMVVATAILIMLVRMCLASGWRRSISLFLLWITMAAVIILMVFMYPMTYLYGHQFNVLFGTRPKNFGERMTMSPKIIASLISTKKEVDDQIAAYVRQKNILAATPRETTGDIQKCISLQRDMEWKLKNIRDRRDFYERKCSAAYYVGFEDEVLAIPDITFDEKPDGHKREKWFK